MEVQAEMEPSSSIRYYSTLLFNIFDFVPGMLWIDLGVIIIGSMDSSAS